ncbi:ATP-binding protein [Rubrobacter naiadicus]|uniref:ATP-binding protein n=1 Tax=Rubrobacter naiadicus TaxID=1392641 RepID=UPI002361FAFA|nr:BTAD domain-containing putative transcriptional regulator [Rubrobacter naiadicus]
MVLQPHRPGEGAGNEAPILIRLLGGFEVAVGGQPVDDGAWRLRKAANLVKLLALASRHRLHRDQVTEVLWTEFDVRSQANNFHRALYFARRALGSAGERSSRYLQLRGGVISLCPDGSLRVDVEAFEGAAAVARRLREPAAYRPALDLYAGDLLPEDRYEAWTEERRDALRRLRVELLMELAALHEERAEYGDQIEALELVLREVPYEEEAHAGLMRAYAAEGRRGEALLQYERLRRVLAEGPGMSPEPTTRLLYERIRSGGIPAPLLHGRHRRSQGGNRAAPVRHNLPASLTSFIGRGAEVREIERLLAMSRLLTLTGAGGSGKTRLALEVAGRVAPLYPDGVWMVELASLSHPAFVVQAVATALGVSERAGRPVEGLLEEHLRGKAVLILLDNCEHLVEEAARLSNVLLRAGARARILATSREPLGIPGETVWSVPTLSLPSAGEEVTVGELMTSEAAQLFVERARSRLTSFEPTQHNAPAVAKICRRLDGLPLAIELAAARVGSLPLEKVAGRLEQSLEILPSGMDRDADPRHRTLRATLDWSHEMLDGDERALFRRLSVFAGPFPLEAAELTCGGGEPEVLEVLPRLVDRSLVLMLRDATLRYRMLEPVRRYAAGKLRESEEEERIRGLHARYYLALAERAEPGLIGAGQAAWLGRLEGEYGNLRAALGWCLDGGDTERAAMGLRMAVALDRFWDAHGPGEGRRWMERGLAGCSPPAALRAGALVEAGFIAVYQLDSRAVGMLEEALGIYRELGDEVGQALAINYLAHAAGILGNLGRVETLRVEAEGLLERTEDPRAAAHLLLTLGMLATLDADHAQVLARTGESLALFREVGDLRSCAQCLTIMGLNALARRDAGHAARIFRDDVLLLRDLGDKVGTVVGLLGLAGVAALEGRHVRSARLFGAAGALGESIGHPPVPLVRTHYDYEGYIAAVRGALGHTTFETAYDEGRSMSPDRAIEYGLSAEETAPSEALLTPRQREVALLVAQGLANRQIASELGISENTVANHVAAIIRRLDVPARSGIAAWVAGQNPRETKNGQKYLRLTHPR